MGEIVSVVSSPVIKGTSDVIVSKIVAGAIGMSTNVIYQYHIAEIDARGCNLCMKCKKSGKCVQKDRVSEIIDHMQTADCIILSTPVIFDNVSWSFKILMDRMTALLDDEGKSIMPEGKELIVVVTYDGDADSAMNVEKYIRDIMVKRFGCKHIGSIVVPVSSKNEENKLNEDLIKAAYIYGNMLSISVPLDTNVVSLDDCDPRRGGYRFPHGHIWTVNDGAVFIKNN